MIHAYLDPASGSAMLSAVVAGAAGAAVAANTIRAKLGFKKRSTDADLADASVDGAGVAHDNDDSEGNDDPAADFRVVTDESVDEPSQ